MLSKPCQTRSTCITCVFAKLPFTNVHYKDSCKFLPVFQIINIIFSTKNELITYHRPFVINIRRVINILIKIIVLLFVHISSGVCVLTAATAVQYKHLV